MSLVQDWQTRLLLERSKAIKCPSAGYHLAGTKKVQQVLAKPGVLERFLTDPEAIRSIRNTFASQYSLDLVSNLYWNMLESDELFIMFC